VTIATASPNPHPLPADLGGTQRLLDLVKPRFVRARRIAQCCLKQLDAYSIRSSARAQHRRNFEAERLRGPEVDHELKFGWRLYGKVAWLLALEDTVDIRSRPPQPINYFRRGAISASVVGRADEDRTTINCRARGRCEPAMALVCFPTGSCAILGKAVASGTRACQRS